MSLLRRLWQPPTRLVIVAFVLHVAVILLLGAYRVPPGDNHWEFGYEMGRIARSIASGMGFSSPYQGETGPTAHFPPVYPLLVAGTFKVFGVYSERAALFLLALNALFSSLICWTLFRIGEQVFNREVGLLAARIWIFHPIAFYFATAWIWETSLSGLLLSGALLATLRVESARRLSAWAWFGLLWGAIAMTNPALLLVLPGNVLWLHCRGRFAPAEIATRIAAFAFVFGLCLIPWTVRNYEVFHRFIPLRSNFWMEVHLGNNEIANGAPTAELHPSHNPAELAEYQRLGEPAYFEKNKRQALDYIRQHPGSFLKLTLWRILLWWTGGWQFTPGKWAAWLVGLEFIGLALQNVLALIGLGLALVRCNPARWLLLNFVFMYSLPYYFLFAGRRHRHPLDSLLLLLAVAAVMAAVQGGRALRQHELLSASASRT